MNSESSQIPRKHWFILLILFIGIKIFYLVFNFSINNDNSTGSIINQYVAIAHKADSNWYKKIASEGYSKVFNESDLGYFKKDKNYCCCVYYKSN